MKKILITAGCFFTIFSIFGQDATALYNQALEKAQAGKMEEAIELFSKTIELQPENYYAWYNRGIARGRVNQYEKALADFEQTIRLEPGYKKAYLNRGIAKRHLTDYEGAIADYTLVTGMDPANADAFYNRGLIYEMLEKKDSACLDYNKAKLLGIKLDNKIDWCNNKSAVKTYHLLRLTRYASSEKYALTPEQPVKVGSGAGGGPANQRTYLELLRDPQGQPVKYSRLGSCCEYKSENGLMGYALVDRYQVSYLDSEGKPATTVIYISFYDYEEPLIPVGFKTIVR